MALAAAACGPGQAGVRARLALVAMLGAHAADTNTERLSPVRHRRFTLAEYHKMIETGILGEDEHLELLEGEIVQMSPHDKPHARALVMLNRWLTRSLGDEYVVRPQVPLTLRTASPSPTSQS